MNAMMMKIYCPHCKQNRRTLIVLTLAGKCRDCGRNYPDHNQSAPRAVVLRQKEVLSTN